MTAHRSPIRRSAAVAVAATAALALAACGGGDDSPAGQGGHHDASSSPSAERGGHNAADVSFAQGMIPHHRQAVEMADLAATRAGSAKVRTLAEQIKKAQGPEITTMSGWLTAWDEQVPGPHAGHAGHTMAGMMTPQEMDALGKSSGRAFDTAFLKMMIKHHEGAVEMAKVEKSQGAYQPARTMAGEVITSQSAEITAMTTLLATD